MIHLLGTVHSKFWKGSKQSRFEILIIQMNNMFKKLRKLLIMQKNGTSSAVFMSAFALVWSPELKAIKSNAYDATLVDHNLKFLWF